MSDYKRRGDDIVLINMSNYVKPEVNEQIGRKWVLYGKDNSFFQFIIDRYNGSPTNESIINVYNSLIYGRGISINGQNEIYEELAELFPKREQRKCISDFKLFGQYAMQILRAKGGGVAKIMHIPMEKLGLERADANGDVDNVYYCDDWTNPYKYKPKAYPIFKGKLNQSIMVKLVQPYTQGQFYFSNPDYLAGLQYAELEEEISNYSVSHIRNGLSFGYVINMNNGGALTPEQKDKIETKIKQKLTGSSNAGKFIISFNDSKESEVTVVPLEVSDAHSQFEFLSSESMTKLLTAHGVTSPILFGLPSAGGFGSNAEELDTASKLLNDYQIKPKQDTFLDELSSILELNNLETDLVFIPLREREEVEEEVVDETVDTEEEEEIEEAEVDLSNHICLADEYEATIELADHLITFGEELDEKEWYLLAVNDVDYETDDIMHEAIQFATSTGVARPNAKSKQDSEDIKILYRYAGNKFPQREFCRKMMFANKLYRKEDILQMERPGINDGFGMNGSNSYSIWMWKGGGKLSAKYPNGTCKHKWQREIYLKRGGGVDVNSPLAKKISVADARRKGYDVPTNEAAVGRTPHNNKV